MRIEPKDRTRILLAFVLTLIALPALISANRSSSDRPATVAAVSSGRGLTAGQQLGSEPSHAVESSPSTTVLAPPPPASSAPTDATREKAGNIAKAVKGVNSVDNQLVVKAN